MTYHDIDPAHVTAARSFLGADAPDKVVAAEARLRGAGQPAVLTSDEWAAHRADWKAVADFLSRGAVCPRCLDRVPGTPGGTPDECHPGPFARDLCAPCAVESAKLYPDTPPTKR